MLIHGCIVNVCFRDSMAELVTDCMAHKALNTYHATLHSPSRLGRSLFQLALWLSSNFLLCAVIPNSQVSVRAVSV